MDNGGLVVPQVQISNVVGPEGGREEETQQRDDGRREVCGVGRKRE